MSRTTPDPELVRAAAVLEHPEAEVETPSSPPRLRWRLPLALFLATIATTTLARGVAYSATLLAILVAHEMGHYVVARRAGVPASLPHFIPLPPFLGGLGTLGAVIRMDDGHADRRSLLHIGAAGPIAGFVLAVPAMLLGLALSEPAPTEPEAGMIYYGQSILSWTLERGFGPPVAPGQDLLAHPVYVAAWAGFLVTALNLMPLGQLDGGHILHAALPKASARIATWVHRIVLGLGVLGGLVELLSLLGPGVGAALAPARPWVSPAFLVWGLVTWRLGVVHPPVAGSGEALRGRHWAVVVVSAVILVLCFMPSPIYTPYMAPVGD